MRKTMLGSLLVLVSLPLPALAGDYHYNPVGRKDPFINPLDKEVVIPPPSDCKERLCQFDVEQLRLTAVVTGQSEPVAMVQDPSGRAYLLKKGTKVGHHKGIVTRIAMGKVVVTEVVYAGQEPKPVERELNLGEEVAQVQAESFEN